MSEHQTCAEAQRERARKAEAALAASEARVAQLVAEVRAWKDGVCQDCVDREKYVAQLASEVRAAEEKAFEWRHEAEKRRLGYERAEQEGAAERERRAKEGQTWHTKWAAAEQRAVRAEEWKAKAMLRLIELEPVHDDLAAAEHRAARAEQLGYALALDDAISIAHEAGADDICEELRALAALRAAGRGDEEAALAPSAKPPPGSGDTASAARAAPDSFNTFNVPGAAAQGEEK